jgi:hypothetical protein
MYVGIFIYKITFRNARNGYIHKQKKIKLAVLAPPEDETHNKNNPHNTL